MRTTIFIPKKINVGYQERQGTYTGKLAYIIYFDEKGKLRKETSWNSWRTLELGNDIIDNIPTEGFVLNKKVGDYNSGWGNHRMAYTRVYDPRGWEFEITIENLLFILEHCTSTKGKGLEGEFVYGWDGKNLILLPVDSPDYKEINSYNDILREDFKLGARTIKIGATYLSKQNVEMTYLGKFDYYDYHYNDKYYFFQDDDDYAYDYIRKKVDKQRFYFCYTDSDGKYRITEEKSIPNKFIAVIDENPHEDYATMYELLETKAYFCPPDFSKTEYIPYEWEEFSSIMTEEFRDRDYKWASETFYTLVRGTLQRVKFMNSNYDDHTAELKPFIECRVPMEEQYRPYYRYDGRLETRTVYKDVEVYFNSLREFFDLYKPSYQVCYLENGKKYKN